MTGFTTLDTFFLFLYDFLGHPFVLLLIAGIGGFLTYKKTILPKEAVDFKITIIRKIVELRILINLARLIYNRVVSTRNIELKKRGAGRASFDPIEFDKIIAREVHEMSAIINDKIPRLDAELVAIFEVFFSKQEQASFLSFRDNLKKIHDRIVRELPRLSNGLTREWSEIPELSLDQFVHGQNLLIEAIKSAPVLQNYIRAGKM